MPSLKRRIRETHVFRAVRHWLSHHSLPGFYNISVYDILTFLGHELRKESLILRANAMAFSFFLAMFPSIIVLFTLLPHLPIKQQMLDIKISLAQMLPADSAQYVSKAIDELTAIPRRGLLSIGLILALYFASNGMISLLRGFEKRYAISYRSRSGFRRRMVAIKLTIFMGLLLILSMILIVMGGIFTDALLTWAVIDFDELVVVVVMRWVVIIALYYTGISFLYRYGPALKERMHFFTPGATLATILTLLSSWAFSFYVNQFDAYNKFYGSLGALIVLMLWMQINSMIILIGYELNASIIVTRALRTE
jgi:membrane protein